MTISMPEAAKRLTQAQRVQLLSASVRLANKAGGLDDLHSIYESLCLLAADPLPGSPTLRVKDLVNSWADACLFADGREGSRMQAIVLYDLFRSWCRDRGQEGIPSMCLWGRAMKERFASMDSGYVWYFVQIKDEGGQPA